MNERLQTIKSFEFRNNVSHQEIFWADYFGLINSCNNQQYLNIPNGSCN